MFHSRKLNHKINHIRERALRLVYNDYTSTFENLLLLDESVSIHHRNIQKAATEMFKAKSNLSPKLTQSIFKPKIRQYLFKAEVYNGEGSLRSFGPIVWNNLLPNKYKSAENVENFKNKIKIFGSLKIVLADYASIMQQALVSYDLFLFYFYTHIYIRCYIYLYLYAVLYGCYNIFYAIFLI